MTSDCIPSTGRPHTEGYRWAVGGRLAHRVAWEAEHGPIPPGAVIDHTCHNADPHCRGGRECPHRACVNVEHLAVSSIGGNSAAALYTRALCRAGVHPLDGPGECEPCRVERRAAWYAQNLEEQRTKARDRMRAKRAAARQ